ncbi:hypothetical protein J132_07574 [Termitomyces sp. J132]|nr:hypothetical protein J132_07574 [Termitomyces sp. J132]
MFQTEQFQLFSAIPVGPYSCRPSEYLYKEYLYKIQLLLALSSEIILEQHITRLKFKIAHQALDFAMTVNAANSNETSYTVELYPSVAAVGAIYDHSEGMYADFLAEGEPTYAEEAWLLWNQPLSGGEEENKTI